MLRVALVVVTRLGNFEAVEWDIPVPEMHADGVVVKPQVRPSESQKLRKSAGRVRQRESGRELAAV